MLNINERLEATLNLVIHLVIWAIVLITPLFFWNLTSEYYDMPKFILLTAGTGAMLVLWVARYAFSGKLSLTRTPLDLPLLMLLAILIISAFFSASKSVAIFGNFPQIHGGLAAYAVYIIFYFVLASNLKSITAVRQTIYLLLVAGIILAILALSSYAGVNLFFLPWTGGLNFTPSGSSFTTAAILTLLLPFPLMSILQNAHTEIFGNPIQGSSPNQPGILSSIFGDQQILQGNLGKSFLKALFTGILVLFAAVIVLTGSLSNIIAAALTFAIVLFVAPPLSIKKNLSYVAVPIIAGAILFLLSSLPIGGSANLLHSRAQNFPREIQLPFTASWKVSVSAFRDSPFWGSGPASYLFDFTSYKPVDFNNSKFWNIRFNSAFNEYLQVLGTLGALGLIALLLLTTLFISFAFKALLSSQSSIGISLSISGIIFFILLALHASTLTLWVVGLLILASFMAVYKNITKESSLASAPTQEVTAGGAKLHFGLLPAIVLAIVSIAVGTGFYHTGKSLLADYHHRQALNAVAAGRGLDGYNELIAAEKLNPYIDVYRTDLAQTNFALANAIASSKAPNEDGTSTLTDQDKQNIQLLLSQAINEGRTAVALSPNNPVNWEILGSIYRQISGVAQNALSFSLDSYGRAIAKDPFNPMLRMTVGGIYYSVRNYEMASRFFTDAINLKSDFANGYYNLAVALKDKGDLVSAAISLEKTISLLDPKTPDYNTASELYKSLRDQIASESAKQQAQASPVTAPAAQTSSALQNKNLPKVIDLPKPENVATPEAIKKQP